MSDDTNALCKQSERETSLHSFYRHETQELCGEMLHSGLKPRQGQCGKRNGCENEDGIGSQRPRGAREDEFERISGSIRCLSSKGDPALLVSRVVG